MSDSQGKSAGNLNVSNDCTQSWLIAVRHISWLWSDLIPRVMAAYWGLIQRDDGVAITVPEPPVQLNDLIPDWIKWFTATGKSVDSMGLGSAEFLWRMGELRKYWTDPATRSLVPPVTYRDVGGYDFVLSNDGIDLYIPEFPRSWASKDTDLSQLLFLYTIRETGRPVLGTPGVAAKYIMPAKEGASQVIPTDADHLEALKAAVGLNGDMRLPNVCGMRDAIINRIDRLLHPMEVVDTSAGGHGPAAFPHLDLPDEAAFEAELERRAARAEEIRDVLREFENGDDLVADFNRVRELWLDAATPPRNLLAQRRSWWGALTAPPSGGGLGGGPSTPRGRFREALGPEEGCTSILDGYIKCDTRKRRCWQLEGTVFRGIAELHPRVVAQEWFEVVTRNGGNFAAGGNEIALGFDWRGKMMERLETALPSAMVMETYQPATLAAAQQTVAGVASPPDSAAELLVSSAGLRFPQHVPPGEPNSAADARTKAFLKEIVVGRAGNPVFTSSDYCD